MDLPTKDHIRKVCDFVTVDLRSIILFMSSSGSARTEMLNLTIQDFIDATYMYHNSNDIYEVLSILKERDDVVPTFKIKRQKTDKWYYTFCSPEAVTAIVNYLLSVKKPLSNTDRLFQYHEVTVCYKFQEINDELGLGKKGTFNRFRSHMLRKFHASNLKNHGMSKEDINEMQGKGQNLVDEAYFFDDPNILREKYIEHMGAITINLDVNSLDIKSEEYLRLEHENEQLKEAIDSIDSRIEDKINAAIKSRTNVLSEDEFLDLFS